jgi:hypothetical protein
MKKHEVKVGGTYTAKVSGKVVPVRIDGQNPRGGWDATNTATGKKVRIKSAQRLRGAVRKSKPMALAIPGQAGGAEPRVEPKAAKKAKAAKAKGERKGGALDAAVQVLKTASGGPLGCKEMVERMLAKGLWQTKGKTPAATLYSAIIREIAKKGKDSRFRKEGRGRFSLTGKEA